VHYVYYDPVTGQVMAEFDTPILADQESWLREGYSRALVRPWDRVTRDHKVVTVNADGYVVAYSESVNPIQPRQLR